MGRDMSMKDIYGVWWVYIMFFVNTVSRNPHKLQKKR